jgi:hypothetical protein
VLLAVVLAVVVARDVMIVIPAAADADTDAVAGVVLDDESGRSWHLDELRGALVLLVIADRRASRQASEWGTRLAAAGAGVLAPWRAAGKIACLAVADLRRVPDYARDAAREGIREREAARSQAERRNCSPLLLDWKGLLAGHFPGEPGEALLVLVSPEHGPLIRARGAPTDEAVARLIEAITGAIPR